MKVKRQGLNESYKTTANWISDFEKTLEKQGNYLDNLKSIFKKRNDFSTIEEKMADIRNRAGFELIKETEDSSISKKASECNACDGACECKGCSCNKYNCKSCNSDFIGKVKTVINYMKEFSDDRPEASVPVIITHCRNHPELNFQEIESKLDNKKFKALLEKTLKRSEDSEKEVKYIPEDGNEKVESDVADYFGHAQPPG